MSAFHRFKSSLGNQGIGGTAGKLRALLVDHWFDFRYGLDICPASELSSLTIQGGNRDKGYRYEPTRLLTVRRLFRAIEPLLPADPVLVDIGSGKGRALLVAAEFGFRSARGVEFAHELCEAARRNCARYKTKTKAATLFEVIESDAARYPFRPEENVFIFFSPFDDSILRPVVANLVASVQQRPRKALIVYYNPKWAEVIEQTSVFTPVCKFDFWSIKTSVYSNQP